MDEQITNATAKGVLTTSKISSELQRSSECQEKDIQVFYDEKGIKSFHCLVCGRIFGRLDKLRRHLRELHYGIKDFECCLCLRKFARNEKLTRHVHEVHHGLKGWRCRVCDKRFSREWVYRRHEQTAHLERSPESIGLVERLPKKVDNTVRTIANNYVYNDDVDNKSHESQIRNGDHDPECILVGDFDQVDPVNMIPQKVSDKQQASIKCYICSETFTHRVKLINHYQEYHFARHKTNSNYKKDQTGST